MNKRLATLAACLLLSSAAYAQYHSHMWTKINEVHGDDGNVICTWKCGYGADAHHATTSGWSACPYKY